jgi:cell volume regulation protein A
MGGDVVSYRLRPGAAAAGHLVRELGLPREALVNVIVRDGAAIPPRGSTELREGDELHILVRGELREQVEDLTRRWHEGPVGVPPPPLLPPRASPQVFSVRPLFDDGDDPSAPEKVGDVQVVAVLRSRRDRPSSLVALADGRYAVVAAGVVAVGGRRELARWCEARAEREEDDPAQRAWWQEVIGALIARG